MKKLKSLLLVCLALTLTSACNYRSGKKKEYVKYAKDGLSFSLPKYWKVTKDRPIEGVADGRLISASNEAPLSRETYMVITKTLKSDNLAQVMDDCINSMRSSHSKRNIEFGLLDQVAKMKVDTTNALRVGFETKALGVHNNGTMTVFNMKNSTFLLVFSGDVKDKKENAKVLDSALRSFRVD